MFCKDCGLEIREGSAFCSKCGASVSARSEIKRRIREYFFLQVTAFILGLLGLVVFLSSFWVADTVHAMLPALDMTVPAVAGVLCAIIGIMLLGQGQLFYLMIDLENNTDYTNQVLEAREPE